MKIRVYDLMLEKDTGITQLCQKDEFEYAIESDQLDNGKKLDELFREVFQLDKRAEEYAYLVCLSANCKLLAVFEVSHGTVKCGLIGRREIGIRLLLAGAVKFILCHNHPSGNSKPSGADIRLTKTLQKMSAILGVEFLDHIIIAGDTHVSLRIEGYM